MSRGSESSQEIETSLKENFKLSSYEARAYLSLLKLGKQNSKQLSSSAAVPLPRIYDTLESLMSKGFAMKQEDFFLAIPPRQALKGRTTQFESQFAIEQRRRKQVEEELISELRAINVSSTKEGKENSEISILKGINAIANKFQELLENSRDVILIAKRAVEAREVFIPILVEFAGNQETKKRIRIITPRTARISKQDSEEARRAGAEIRKSDSVLFDMMITDTDDVIIGVPDPLSEEINHAVAIWVRNQSFARSTRQSIEEIWKASERA